MTTKSGIKPKKAAKTSITKHFVIDEDIRQFFPKVSPMGGNNPNEGNWINQNSITPARTSTLTRTEKSL